MGFLDHSTNNIIVDAVLTDLGRRVLADNQGRFRIKKFSLSDDEVDYGIIRKYGRAVGKEKIVKNTPIFEAQTRESLALKYRMMTVNDPTIVFLPSLSLTIIGTASNGQVVLNVQNSTSATISFEQQINAAQLQVPVGLADGEFVISMSDRFLKLNNREPDTVEPGTKTAYYIIEASSETTAAGGSKGSFVLQPQSGLDSSIFSVYSNAGEGNRITTIVTVIGQSSGIRKDFVVNIDRQANN
jgi:hypothetical protein